MAKIFPENFRFDAASTLFVSDLDGTLLTPHAELPDGAASLAHELTKSGVKLTFSTARTIRSVSHILADMPFSAPVSLMNGTLLRDMDAGRYVQKNIPSLEDVLAVLARGGSPFLYLLDRNDELVCAYREIANEHMAHFMNERVVRYAKPFVKASDLCALAHTHTAIYFCYVDTRENLAPIADAACEIPGLSSTFYPDRHRPDAWYLEVFSKSADKGSAMDALRRLTGAKTLVAFGDNTNDLPMLEKADFAFAVSRAAEPLKAAADGIVDDGIGILEFIRTHTLS